MTVTTEPERSLLTVGLFGYYSYRNFGDNLMAYLLHEHIEDAGQRALIYTKDPFFHEEYGFATESSLERLAHRSDLIVLGGGGLLIPRTQTTGSSAEFSSDMQRLMELAAQRGVPIYAISVGGAGVPLSQIEPEARRALVSKVSYVTLRNEEDLQLLAQAGVPGEFLHDIVWTTPLRLPRHAPARPSQTMKVGISLYLGKSKRYMVLRILLRCIVLLRRDCDFVFYDIHPMPGAGFRAMYVPSRHGNTSKSVLLELNAAVREVASLDLLITSRLHLGVVAMSYGIPSIAYAPQEKTRLLYRRIGLENMLWGSGEIHNFVALFLTPGRVRSLRSKMRGFDLTAVRESASGHYARLSNILARHERASDHAEKSGERD